MNFDDEDFHFKSKNRDLLISQLAKIYFNNTKKMLKICEVEQKSLKQYITPKKDKKKNTSYTKMDQKFSIDTKAYIEKHNNISEKELETDKDEKKKKVGTIMDKYSIYFFWINFTISNIHERICWKMVLIFFFWVLFID